MLLIPLMFHENTPVLSMGGSWRLPGWALLLSVYIVVWDLMVLVSCASQPHRWADNTGHDHPMSHFQNKVKVLSYYS
jgi:hypothetical protein